MSRGKKHRRTRTSGDGATKSSAPPASGKPQVEAPGSVQGPPTSAPGGGGGKLNRRRTWLETHGRDLRFLAIFAVLMGCYYGATTTSAVKDRFFPWYLGWSARASTGVLHLFGNDDLEIRGRSLVSKHGAVSVERGCDAVEPSALFVSAVLASPVPLLSRVGAALVGTLVLMVLNLVRIITLYLTAIHWRKAFDVMHLDVWQAAFIFLAILMWALWAAGVSRRRRRRTDAGA